MSVHSSIYLYFRCLSAKGGKPGLEKCQELSSNQKWVFIESKPHWA